MSSSANATEIGIGIVVVAASSSLSSACMALPFAKATPSGITVSGLGLSLLSRRAGGSTHYAIIHHSNLKVI